MSPPSEKIVGLIEGALNLGKLNEGAEGRLTDAAESLASLAAFWTLSAVLWKTCLHLTTGNARTAFADKHEHKVFQAGLAKALPSLTGQAQR